MDEPASVIGMSGHRRPISEIVAEEGARLRNFIRRRVPDPADAEDIAQEVFYELVEANHLLMPIEHVTAGCFASLAIALRTFSAKRSRRVLATPRLRLTTVRCCGLKTYCHRGCGTGRALRRSVLLDELELALDELPQEQRDVFVAHEIEGRSFKEIADESGVSLNTLLSRKHYAVLHLRERLRNIYNEFTKA